MKRIFDGVVTLGTDKGHSIYQVWKEQQERHKEAAGVEYWYYMTTAQLEAFCGEYVEVTEEVYWYFFEMLPPIYIGSGFAMSERLTDNISSAFFEIGGRYFSTHVNLSGDKYLPARLIREAEGL